METKKVEKAVEENPGITFTELKQKLGLENGQLQYHLKKSKAFQKDKAYVTRKACNECSLEDQCREECILHVLNNSIRRKVCREIGKDKSKKQIAEELGITPSTLSYHLNILRNAEVIEKGEVVPEISEEVLYQNRQ